jgi:hypothetical protein
MKFLSNILVKAGLVVEGSTQLNSLAGVGTRMVVANAAGIVSTQAIPVTSVFGRTGAVVAQVGDYTTAQVTESGNLYYTDARARAAISLTTTGSSGAATYTAGVLNIPNYTLAGLGGISGSGASGQVAYWTGTSVQSGSNNLFWDNAQGRLGIGTNAPLSRLHLKPTTTATSAIIIEHPETTPSAFGRTNIYITGNGQTTTGANNAEFSFSVAGPGSGSGTDGPYFFARGNSYSRIANQRGLLGFVAGNISTPVGLDGSLYFLAESSFIDFMTGLSATSRLRIHNNGNVGIGFGATDPAVRLGVSGDTLLRGSGNTSATNALTVQNSASATMMSISNDAANTILNITGSTYSVFQANQTTANRNVYFGTTGTGVEFGVGTSIATYTFLNGSGYGLLRINTAPIPTAGGNVIDLPVINTPFQPTSGTATFTLLHMRPNINQVGATGITRGLYVNPTLTAAADWRSIEWSNNSGWGLYGAGTANNYLAGSLLIGSTNNFAKLYVAGPTLSGTTQTYIGSQPTINQPLTNLQCFWSNIVGNLASTVTNAYSYIASQSGIASSTITNLFGFTADSSLSAATNVYGFYGNIASGTGRWNLYMAGTADNYLAGNLGIGITPTVKLHVSGDTILKGSGATSATTALTVQNSSSTNLFSVRNDGLSTFGGSVAINSTTTFNANTTLTGSGLMNHQIISTSTTGYSYLIFKNTATSGREMHIALGGSGTGANANLFYISDETAGVKRLQIDSTGNLGIGTTPTALTDIGASTTTRASLRIRSGTAPTTPNDGDIWFDGTDIKMRIGGVTKTFTLI